LTGVDSKRRVAFFSTLYNNMNSKAFGPPLWDSMYFIASGYDLNTDPGKDELYVQFFIDLGNVIPCRFCRDSYGVFVKELGIKRYLYSPCGLMKFVYDLHEKVSEKLRHQENGVLKQEFEKLVKLNTDETTFWNAFRKEAQFICNTKPTPDFNEVVTHYDQFRASCSAQLQSCRKPLKESMEKKKIYGPLKTDSIAMGVNSVKFPARGGKKSRSKSASRSTVDRKVQVKGRSKMKQRGSPRSKSKQGAYR
jgi:hypothetical protein